MKGPKKIFPDMPFGNMDSDKIEARKGLLESFLKVGGFILLRSLSILNQHLFMFLMSGCVPSLAVFFSNSVPFLR